MGRKLLMIATCIHRETLEIPEQHRGPLASKNHVYDVTVGKRYHVLAMGIWETMFMLLIRDDLGRRSGLPAALFDIDGQPVPEEWYFGLRDGIRLSMPQALTHWVAVWGYHEFVEDPRHISELMDLKPEAIEIFRREYRKAVEDFPLSDDDAGEGSQV